MKPQTLMRWIRFWPPFFASGIAVIDFDLDSGWIKSQLKMSWWNRNYFGTHFGGSLFAMGDPFYVFILIHLLGKEYAIWDLKTQIEFKKATGKNVTALFKVTTDQVEAIRRQAQEGLRVEPEFEFDILDPEGQVICHVKKTLYIRKKVQK